jgi:hypothetical protein
LTVVMAELDWLGEVLCFLRVRRGIV